MLSGGAQGLETIRRGQGGEYPPPAEGDHHCDQATPDHRRDRPEERGHAGLEGTELVGGADEDVLDRVYAPRSRSGVASATVVERMFTL